MAPPWWWTYRAGTLADAAGTYWHGWLWEAEALVLTDFAEQDVCHRHVALQVVVSFGEHTAMRLADGDWRVNLGTVVASDAPHAYDSRRDPSLGLWIDATSTVARALADRYLSTEPFALLDEQVCRQLASSAPSAGGPPPTLAAARALFEHATKPCSASCHGASRSTRAWPRCCVAWRQRPACLRWPNWRQASVFALPDCNT